MAAEAYNTSIEQPEKQDADETTTNLEKMNISFSIWPPTQRTRDAVIKNLIETLTTTSILTKRYGTLTAGESTAVSERMENEAFNAVSAAAVSANDDGIEILHAYSKEISKRMLDYMKSRPVSSEAASTVDEESDSIVEEAD